MKTHSRVRLDCHAYLRRAVSLIRTLQKQADSVIAEDARRAILKARNETTVTFRKVWKNRIEL